MSRLSPERVKQELEKTMEQVKRPGRALALWKRTGVLATVIPSLANVGDDTLAALDLLPAPVLAPKAFRLFTRVAALFIELGESGARAALTALRFPRAEIRRVAELAATWSELGASLGAMVTRGETPTDSQVRRWVAAIGRLDLAPFMRIAGALWQSRRPDDRAIRGRLSSLYRRMLRVARSDPIEIADLAIDGEDLVGAGIPPGPGVGKILKALLEAVLEDPSRNNRDWLLRHSQSVLVD